MKWLWSYPGCPSPFGKKVFGQNCSRLDEEMISDRRSEQRFNDWGIGSATSIGVRKETNTSREQWRVLCGAIPHRAERHHNQGNAPC